MPAIEHIPAIRDLKPKTLIDVGANKGQFSLVARYLFSQVEIHAFEPLHSQLLQYKRVVKGPVIHYSVALGAETAQSIFYVTSRADSSSLLRPDKALQGHLGVKTVSTTIVAVKRLFEVVDFAKLSRPLVIKIDVQGGELDVLKGVDSGLDFVDAVYCEVSFKKLYEQQPLADEIRDYLECRGFMLKGTYNETPSSSRTPLQADFLFVRAPGLV